MTPFATPTPASSLAATYPEFSQDFNASGMDARFNPTSSLVSDVVGGIAASVVDFGASVWNSLPMTPEVQTSDLLAKISDNALRVYNENPDTIETASFIGGMFVPAGLAMKGMKMLRDGSKAVNWFTTAGRAEDTAKVAKAFAESGAATKAYRVARNELYAKGAANQVLDTVAAEFAILSVMNAHPVMEDYMADPVKNFTISIAGGSVLGAGIGHIADRFIVKQATGKMTEEALTTIRDQMKVVEPGMTNAVALQSHYVNVQNLSTIIEEGVQAGKNTTDDLTLSIADKMRTQAINARMEIFDTMISPSMRNLPVEQKQVMMDTLGYAPEMHGVNDIRFITDKESVSRGFVNADPSINMSAKPTLVRTRVNQNGVTIKTEVPVIYYPALGAYAPMGSQIHYGGANVVVNSLEEAAKRLSPTSHQNPNFDSAIELMATSAPIAQTNTLAHIYKYANLEYKKTSSILVSNSDLESITGLIHRMRVDPDMAGKKIKVSDKSALYAAKLNQTIVQQGPLTKKYTDAVDQVLNMSTIQQKDHINISLDTSVSAEARGAIQTWVGGNQWPLQKGATAEFLKHRSFSRGALTDPAVINERKLIQEIYESNASKKAREKLRQASDNGFIYLYRGTHTSVLKGSAPLESMTTDFAKANEFAHARGKGTGTVNMYKVDVDDVVAIFEDFGKSTNQVEIMVRSSAREAKISMDTTGKVTYQAVPSSRVVTKSDAIHDAGLEDLIGFAKTERAERLDAMIAQGIPPASISLRTNTPVHVVEAYMSDASAGPQVLERILEKMKQNGLSGVDYETGAMISTLDQAQEALSITKKPLVLTGDIKKNPYVEAHANLDNKAMKDINDTFIKTVLAGSTSTIVKEWGTFMGENETMFQMLTQQLGKVNQEFAGNRFFNSADFWARNMGEVGPIASTIGKFTQRMSNSMIGRVTTPIQDAMNVISKDQAAVIEFATFKNINDGLKGFRKFEESTGRLLQQVPKEVEVNGKMKTIMVFEPVKFNGIDYVVATPAVRNLVIEMQRQSKELRDLHNTVRKIKGEKDINDIGLWIPTFNPANKFIAYLHDMKTGTTKVIAANNMEQYAEAIKHHKNKIAESGETNIKVIERGQEQEMWSKLNGRLDPVYMERADVGKLKEGSAAPADIRADLGIFGEIVGGYEHYITTQARNLVDITMSDVTFTLDRMSTINKWGFEGQPLSKVAKATKGPKDPAESLKNILVGSTGLAEYGSWKDANTTFETGLSYAINGIASAWNTATAPLKKGFFGQAKELDAKALEKLDYQKLVIDMKNRGIVNPWEDMDTASAIEKFGISKLEDAPDISKRVVYAGNALAATLALKVGELAQPLVNIMSLPILTHLAAAQRMPDTFMGVQKGTAKVGAIQIMYEGARASNSAHWKGRFEEAWKKAGYFDQMISEANDTLHQSRKLDKGAIAATERALDSALVNFLSRPADASESIVRRQTMYTGAVLAKRMYPDLSDTAITIFARDFMDKAVGNFHAPQRPVFFQGTMGVALGLFQTYSLTLGQSMYRHLELKNYKELGKAALLQSTLFGTSSVPGFAAISNMIGEHFSDDHVDLETGAFRAIQDNMAETILYGLPSQIGVGTHTRGDANFRIPGLTGDSVVAINFAKQFTQSVQQMADAVGNADKSVPQAFAEALSMQALSRPLARGAEIAMGYSVTREGNTVQTPEEVWTLAGVMARVIGTRPLEEIKLRNAMHLNSYYGSIDYDRRQALMSDIKTRIRAGALEEEDIAKASLKYLEAGGTPTGWRSAMARAIGSEQTDGKETLLNKLRPDSPLNYMLNSLDGY